MNQHFYWFRSIDSPPSDESSSCLLIAISQMSGIAVIGIRYVIQPFRIKDAKPWDTVSCNRLNLTLSYFSHSILYSYVLPSLIFALFASLLKAAVMAQNDSEIFKLRFVGWHLSATPNLMSKVYKMITNLIKQLYK